MLPTLWRYQILTHLHGKLAGHKFAACRVHFLHCLRLSAVVAGRPSAMEMGEVIRV